MLEFKLDSRLETDTHPIGDLALCRVLLMDDARFAWLILVPRRPDLAEIIDLPADERGRLIEEIAAACQALKTDFSPDKLNVAALGNHVRQLHAHVIARYVSDAAWPNAPFGHGKRVPYPPHMAGSMVDRLFKTLRPSGIREISA